MSTDFTALLYGEGSWLGILLLLALVTMVSLKGKWLSLLMVPVTVFMGINYVTQDVPMLWHGLIMFISTLFIVLNLGLERE